MSKAKSETIKVTEPPKIPMGFGKKSVGFGGPKLGGMKGQFAPPAPRITQNKGGGGK